MASSDRGWQKSHITGKTGDSRWNAFSQQFLRKAGKHCLLNAENAFSTLLLASRSFEVLHHGCNL